MPCDTKTTGPWSSPSYPLHPLQRAVPATPADRTDASIDCIPVHVAFPRVPAGWASAASLENPSLVGDPTAQCGHRHEASTQPVARPSRSSATRPIDNPLGRAVLRWRYAPSGRTEISELDADRVSPIRAAPASPHRPTRRYRKRHRTKGNAIPATAVDPPRHRAPASPRYRQDRRPVGNGIPQMFLLYALIDRGIRRPCPDCTAIDCCHQFKVPSR